MATVPKERRAREIDYPTGDGKPMAETELHLFVMFDTIEMLRDHLAHEPDVHVGSNLLLFYEEGDRRKHVAPDAFVAFGVPKEPPRDNYLVWKEGKAPDLIVEITSKSTRRTDRTKKQVIYREILKVTEYFLFDPTQDYLKPPLQGFRLVDGDYVAIELVDGRLPSGVLGLHLERDGTKLRLYNPIIGDYLMTRLEAREAAKRLAEAAKNEARAAETRANAAENRADAAENRADAAEAEQRRLADEIERLRSENEQLRGV